MLCLSLFLPFSAFAEPLDPVSPQSNDNEISEEPIEKTVEVLPQVDNSSLPPLQSLEKSLKQIDSNHRPIYVHRDDNGQVLIVDGKPFMIRGMNWGYVPIGTNYSYNFWGQDQAFIKIALDREMTLLKAMGANAIRQYAGIPPKWVTYIYETYGIYTIVNHTMGRYGLNIDGAWVPNTNYQDPKTRLVIKDQIREFVALYKNTPGVLMWMLGNENNYGLHWTSFEIEALPKEEQGKALAQHLYSLKGELIDLIHELDSDQRLPVSIANGDLLYLDLVKTHCPNLDVFGSNVYRGESARDLYQRVSDELNVPVYFTEFGADAYNAKDMREDGVAQAKYLKAQWQEIYLQSYGHKQVGNAIGGVVFQWSDGWWKHKQTENLDIQDTTASWPNGGYPHDFVAGQNNMNEEWFGICAKEPPNEDGHFLLRPRPAYYTLKDVWKNGPYRELQTHADVAEHFEPIDPETHEHAYELSLMRAKQAELSQARLLKMRTELSMIGSNLNSDSGPMAVDNMQSVFLDFQAKPSKKLKGYASLNILGNVAQTPIDELFYEARGRRETLVDAEGEELDWVDKERLKIYGASIDWKADDFNMNLFYRTGHFHWAYEGDFFNFYREANYGDSIDIYDADVPFGVEFEFKKHLAGLKVAFGPQMYWGANPGIIGKYHRKIHQGEFAIVHHEDIAAQGSVDSTSVIPQQFNRRTSLYFKRQFPGVALEVGALMSGTPRLGERYIDVQAAATNLSYNGSSGYDVIENTIQFHDTLGAKFKLSGNLGSALAYAQGGYQGRVSDGGSDQTLTYTGWRLKEPGVGNNYHALAGALFGVGPIQVAPNVLYQKPISGPLPSVSAFVDPTSGAYYPALSPRNILNDPFQVIANRETIAAELMFVYDPTPGSWFFEWDNDVQEDAEFAASLDIVYRHQPTSRDANIGFNSAGDLFAFASSPPAADLWEVNARIVSRKGLSRTIANVYGGTAQARGDDTRLVHRFGADLRYWRRRFAMRMTIKINDWGPYDYHQDYNLTFPFQLIGDISYGMKPPRYEGDNPRIGIRGKYRTRDQYSPELLTDNGDTDHHTHQYEVGTYVHFGF